MQLQPFFNQAPSIQLYDPLAQFLGATPDGVLEYHYADAVKLCGHSCPTVASAWLMVIKALAALYSPDELPERGNIEISMSGERDAGVTGVIASVAQLITGAAPETGFGGIGMAGPPGLPRRGPTPSDEPVPDGAQEVVATDRVILACSAGAAPRLARGGPGPARGPPRRYDFAPPRHRQSRARGV